MSLGLWDIVLIVAVTSQATILAYLRHPHWKALVLSLPVPSTLATLSLGRRVGVDTLLGLDLLFLYTQGVRWMHQDAGLPIVPSIVTSAVGYCAIGALLAPVVPDTEVAFWAIGVATVAAGAALLMLMPERDEPGHRTSLPLWIKVPIIAAVILGLIAAKKLLQGFMTVFPMVGVVAAYEARHSLWTIGRQIPVAMITITILMMVSHAAQPSLGLAPSLAVGWLVFLTAFYPFGRGMWRRASGDGAVGSAANAAVDSVDRTVSSVPGGTPPPVEACDGESV